MTSRSGLLIATGFMGIGGAVLAVYCMAHGRDMLALINALLAGVNLACMVSLMRVR